PGLSRAAARHLLKELGLPQHIFAGSAAALAQHVPQDLADRLSAAPEPDIQSALDNTIQMLSRPDHHLLTLADPGYPAALFDTGDPPLLLVIRGIPELLVRPSVAILGARSAIVVGKHTARAIARYLAGRGWTIISGLAR